MGESEILINGYKVARVNRKAWPGVVARGFAIGLADAFSARFCFGNQCDRRGLKLPQGALGYTGRNGGKRAKNRELAEL
jgi:hypothetical protein